MSVQSNTIASFLGIPSKASVTAGVSEGEADAEDEAELFYLQSEADHLRLQLAKMQEKILRLESAWEPLQLARPTGTGAAATWDAAGLGPSAELETAILTIENWIFTQSNYQSLTDAGWLAYLYDILEESIRTASNSRQHLKIDLAMARKVE